jgi:hypothetical protein
VQEDLGVTVLTESRRRTYGSSEARRTWRAGQSRTAVTRVERLGTRMEYATRERVWWFGPQNHRWRVYGFGLKTWAEVPRRNGRHVAAYQGVRIEAKLPVRIRGGRRMKMTPG